MTDEPLFLDEEHIARMEQNLEMERIRNTNLEAELEGVKRELAEKVMENQILGALDMEQLNRTNVVALKAAQLEATELKKKTEDLEKKLEKVEKDHAEKIKEKDVAMEGTSSKCLKLEEELSELKLHLANALNDDKHAKLLETNQKNLVEIDGLLNELLAKNESEAKAKTEIEELHSKISRLEGTLGTVLNEKAADEEALRQKDCQLVGMTNRCTLLEDRLKSMKKRFGEETEELNQKLDQQQTTIITLARLLSERSSAKESGRLSIASNCSTISNETPEGNTISTYPTLEALDRLGPSSSSAADYLNTLCTLCSWEFQEGQETTKCDSCGMQVHNECALLNRHKNSGCFGCGKRVAVAQVEQQTD